MVKKTLQSQSLLGIIPHESLAGVALKHTRQRSLITNGNC